MKATCLTIFFCSLIYLIGNGRVALWDRDEPRYAMASRYMLTSHDWVVPHIGWGLKPETQRNKKPAFTYWCQAGAMELFGPTTFAARFPSSISTILILLGLSQITRRYLTRTHAFWLVFILGTSAMLLVASKMCVTDTILLLFITTAQVCLFAIYRGFKSLWFPLIFWLALGLGALTKGPVALGIPATTLVVLAIIDWRRKRSRSWWLKTRPIMGLIILALVCGPWLWMVQHRAPNFLWNAVKHEVGDRIATGQEGHNPPPGFYLATIFGTFFPWSLLLPLAFVVAKKRLTLPHVRFAIAAVIGPWILMELVTTKLVHYVLPIFPPLAFLTADAVLRCIRGRHHGLINRASEIGIGVWAGGVVICAFLPWLLIIGKPAGNPPYLAMAVMTAAGVAYAGIVCGFFNQKRPVAGLLSMGIGFGLTCAIIFGWFLPTAGFLRLPIRIASDLNAMDIHRPGQVLMMDYKEQSLAFYQGGTIDSAWNDFLPTHDVKAWPEWMILTQTVLDGTPAEKRKHLQLVKEYQGLNYAAGKWVKVMLMKKI